MKLTDIPVTTIDGTATTLAPHEGKVMLIVNVASRCGLAPQYEKLEAMQKQYGEAGFTVLGFPSNQFLQELGKNDDIKEYCSTTWGVTFPMYDRVKLNGKNAHPLYAELTKTPDASGKAGKVTWNFEKFVVTPDGTAPIPSENRTGCARNHRAHRVIPPRQVVLDMGKTFAHEPDARRYVMKIDDELVAVADYRINGDAISFNHTFTNPKLRGQGYAGEVVEFAMNDVEKTTDRSVVPMCWYVGKWFDEHPERAGLLTRGQAHSAG